MAKKTDKKPVLKMPEAPIDSVQLDLFRATMPTGYDEVSNTLHLWDATPKFSVSRREQNKMRTKEGDFLENYYRDFSFVSGCDKYSCGIEIQPARIRGKDGKNISYYPSEREALVESALRKIFEDEQLFGIYDRAKGRTWVSFTANQIRKELKERGHTLSHKEVTESIDILARSELTLYKDDKAIYSGGFIGDLIRVDRDDYEGDGHVRWQCQFPTLMSMAIESGQYSQFDYALSMDLKSPVARYIYLRMCRRFTQASHDTSYNVSFDGIKNDSGLLDAGNRQDQMRKLEKALNELIAHEVIEKGYIKDEKREARKIKSLVYKVRPTAKFVTQQKANNTRTALVHKQLEEERKKEALEHTPDQ